VEAATMHQYFPKNPTSPRRKHHFGNPVLPKDAQAISIVASHVHLLLMLLILS
jgi:hypothetical protein